MGCGWVACWKSGNSTGLVKVLRGLPCFGVTVYVGGMNLIHLPRKCYHVFPIHAYPLGCLYMGET